MNRKLKVEIRKYYVQVKMLHKPVKLSCYDMYKIVTWLDYENQSLELTRAVSDCLIRPLPASVNALLVNCAKAKNMKVTGIPF